MSGPICGQRATLVATRVINCGCGKIGEQRYALVPGGLASWTGMVSVDLASCEPNTRSMVLG